MHPRHVDSPDDPDLEPYRMVRDRDSAGPDGRPGLFIGESPLVIDAMLHAGIEVVSVLASERQRERAVSLVAGACAASGRSHAPPILLAPDDVLNAVVGFDIHRGFLAVGRRPRVRSVVELLPPPGVAALLLLVEEVNNIDNIGQLFRNAAAFGCSAVLLSPGCHDPLYRKSLRVSCGCALKVPFARSDDWHGDISRLRALGFTVLGATGGGELTLAEAARACSAATPRRVAVAVGAEYSGLAPATLAACSARVRIPMAPGVDSLNVGVATGVFLARLSEHD